MYQKYIKISLVCLAGSFLAACSSGPESPPPLEWEGTCTPAPKKATSRPYQINGVWYYPQPHYEYEEEGLASYYGGGDVFHGRKTATGERFDMNEVTAAHKTVPLPCMAEVTNLENGRQIQVKVNDRGPFIDGRIIDVSRRVAQLLGFEKKGTTKVKVRILVPESLVLNGLDPEKFVAPKEIMLAEDAIDLPKLPDSFFEEASTVTAVALADAPSIMPTPSSSKSVEPVSSGIFVEVGKFEEHEEAHAHSKRMDGLNDVPIEPVKTRGPKPFTVRVGPLLSMSHANQVLDQLVLAGHLMSRIVIQR